MISPTLFLPAALALITAAACSDGDQRSSHLPDTIAVRSWTVTPGGIGPIRVGMTVAEARAAIGSELPSPADSTCAYITPAVGPRGVLLMVAGGRVVRVDVRDTTVATSAGARVGSTETEIERLYPGRVSVTPHKYTMGHYLTVAPAAPADSLFRIVFETDSGRATTYRAGMLPMVEWVEGCS
ncbi:MAG TPA: hypothetical protein VIQ74_03255 [Gemmatimonadaceae bacterium]